MSKLKDPYYFNKIKIVDLLSEVSNRLEGQHSNIPVCCIDHFIYIGNYTDLKDELEEEGRKDLLKKLKKFDYVPCRDCLENKEPNVLNMNGTSDVGKMILAILDIVKNRGEKNERKSNRRSKK